jgi:hypothetical protein
MINNGMYETRGRLFVLRDGRGNIMLSYVSLLGSKKCQLYMESEI